jgi:hypothetical protein
VSFIGTSEGNLGHGIYYNSKIIYAQSPHAIFLKQKAYRLTRESMTPMSGKKTPMSGRRGGILILLKTLKRKRRRGGGFAYDTMRLEPAARLRFACFKTAAALAVASAARTRSQCVVTA